MAIRSYMLAEDSKTARKLFNLSGGLHQIAQDKSFEVVETPGITDVRLQSLCSILISKPHTKLIVEEKSSDGERCLFKIPDELVSRLADLPQTDFDSVAQQWLNLEPAMFRSHVKLSDMKKGLRQLVEIMAHAKKRQSPVFLLVSL